LRTWLAGCGGLGRESLKAKEEFQQALKILERVPGTQKISPKNP